MKKDTVKRIVIGGWILLISFGIILIMVLRPNLLKEDTVDANPYLIDTQDYNLTIDVDLDYKYSPLFVCKSSSIPDYLDKLADEIDSSLFKVNSTQTISWSNRGQDVLLYDKDRKVLDMNLSGYLEEIRFESIERFLSQYIDSSIKHSEPVVESNNERTIYRANRVVDGNEVKTGYGYSDYFLVENGYLRSARILLADIEEIRYVVPMIRDTERLNIYLSNPRYPKSIVLDTKSLITVDEYTYETIDPEIEYQSCLINQVQPQIYFSSCSQNYTPYLYDVSGVCDINYENQLYTVPFSGFINALEPEYVKSIE